MARPAPSPGLRVLTWPAGSWSLLVPAAAVLEVVRLPVAGAPLLAALPWRGYTPPVFAPTDEPPPRGARLLICAGPLPAPVPVAILAREQPRLTLITAADLAAPAAAQAALPGPGASPPAGAVATTTPIDDALADGLLRPLPWRHGTAAVLDLAAIQRVLTAV